DRALLEWKSLPGVEVVGVGSDLPWTGYDDNLGGMRYDDRPVDPDAHARYHVASQNYFRALGIPLLAGRFFDDHDTTQSTKVMIINQAMARRYWPNENVIGKRIGFGPENDPGWTTIVGVVGDIKDQPNSSGAEPAFWWPVDQMLFSFPKMSVVMRGAREPALL